MYDFHKIPHVRQGVLVGDNTGNEIWEFSNHNFQRGREDLLELVTRKRNRDRDETDKDKTDLKYLTKEITSIKEHQNNINTDLTNLRKENVVIWQETLASREKHQKHQQIIKKLLQLLTVLFSNDNISLNTKQLIEGSQSTIENDYRNTKDAFTPLHSNQYTNVFSENNYFLQSDTLLHSSKSTVATRHDVDKVEQNVENLAGQIGINLSYIPKDLTDFTPDQNYHQFINSISKEDKTKPFKMANNVEDTNIQQPIHAPTWCFENFEKLSSSKDPPTNYHSFSESNQIHTPSQFISTQYYTNSTSAANTTNALVSAVYHTRQTATPSFPTPTYNRYSLFNRN